MTDGLAAPAARCQHGLRDQQIPLVVARRQATERNPTMQWQTPTATDMRFGFEITMYVAAR